MAAMSEHLIERVKADIAELNYTYLVLARELGQSQPLAAEVMLGLDAPTACLLADLRLDQLRALAQNPVCLLQCRFDSAFWSELANAAARGSGLDTLHLRAAVRATGY